jgi:mono/diheme cytochrome c family protein
MKKEFKAISRLLIAASAGVMVMSSCISDPDSSGLEYMPDMYRSPAIETYVDYGEVRGVENKEVKVLQSAMRPPHRTIPYYGTDSTKVALMMPYHRKASSAANTTHGLFASDGWILSDSLSADYENAKQDKNPIRLTAENSEDILDRGKKLYESKCQHCHGEEGNGKGSMVESGAYAGVPDYKNLMELGDGQVFYSIYYGKGAMGAHSMMLNKEEIWTLVHYVNQFRFDDYGDFEAEETVVSDSLDADVSDADSLSTEGL